MCDLRCSCSVCSSGRWPGGAWWRLSGQACAPGSPRELSARSALPAGWRSSCSAWRHSYSPCFLHKVSYPIHIVDVFTERALTGNQLAVVLGADGIPPDVMQRVAREMNFSETTFVMTPSQPGNAARVRIFTPEIELPFAGHPTVGTAWVL